jgi:hypothetical protein
MPLIIVRIVKFRRLQWVGYTAQMEETRKAYKILVGSLLRKQPLEE